MLSVFAYLQENELRKQCLQEKHKELINNIINTAILAEPNSVLTVL